VRPSPGGADAGPAAAHEKWARVRAGPHGFSVIIGADDAVPGGPDDLPWRRGRPLAEYFKNGDTTYDQTGGGKTIISGESDRLFAGDGTWRYIGGDVCFATDPGGAARTTTYSAGLDAGVMRPTEWL